MVSARFFKKCLDEKDEMFRVALTQQWGSTEATVKLQSSYSETIVKTSSEASVKQQVRCSETAVRQRESTSEDGVKMQ